MTAQQIDQTTEAAEAVSERAKKAEKVDFKMISFSLAGKEYGIDIMSVKEIAAEEGEAEPLFAEVRRRGEIREIPLLYQTLRQFVEGRLNTANGGVFAESARLPLDLSAEVDAEVQVR